MRLIALLMLVACGGGFTPGGYSPDELLTEAEGLSQSDTPYPRSPRGDRLRPDRILLHVPGKVIDPTMEEPAVEYRYTKCDPDLQVAADKYLEIQNAIGDATSYKDPGGKFVGLFDPGDSDESCSFYFARIPE